MLAIQLGVESVNNVFCGVMWANSGFFVCSFSLRHNLFDLSVKAFEFTLSKHMAFLLKCSLMQYLWHQFYEFIMECLCILK